MIISLAGCSTLQGLIPNRSLDATEAAQAALDPANEDQRLCARIRFVQAPYPRTSPEWLTWWKGLEEQYPSLGKTVRGNNAVLLQAGCLPKQF
ncbi:MAG: hypothetical protein AAF720_00950 [Pseudomonadota bacterium]